MLYLRVSLTVRYIFLIWLVLTLINLTKAYHIDDTFHLEAAANIKENPLRPMSGYIIWDDIPRPMYQHNQPPLFFYIMMVTQLFWGQSEIVMHLLLSVFTFISLLYFSKICKLLKIEDNKSLLLLFGFCPAFIINQNVMTDVPILSIMMSAYYYLIKGQIGNSTKYYIRSSLLLSVGLLIKYSILPFLIVIFLTALLSKQYKNILVVFIPLLILSLWSLWNKYEYGAIHILSRPKIIFNYKLIFGFLSTVGSLSFFTFLYARSILFDDLKKGIITIFLAVLALYLMHKYLIHKISIDGILSLIFITNGILLYVVLFIKTIQLVVINKFRFFKLPSFPLIIGIFGISLFIVLYAPFNATRHVLIIIPLILLFGYLNFKIIRDKILYATISITMFLGLLLALADWNYADFYRRTPSLIKKGDETYWSIGLWGWKWYSKKAGMVIYSSTDSAKLKRGDYIVYPKYVPKQEFPKNIEVAVVEQYIHKPGIFTYLSVHNARFYNSSFNKPSWTFFDASYDTIYVLKIIKIKNRL
jgi:hypothetical protein